MAENNTGYLLSAGACIPEEYHRFIQCPIDLETCENPAHAGLQIKNILGGKENGMET